MLKFPAEFNITKKNLHCDKYADEKGGMLSLEKLEGLLQQKLKWGLLGEGGGVFGDGSKNSSTEATASNTLNEVLKSLSLMTKNFEAAIKQTQYQQQQFVPPQVQQQWQQPQHPWQQPQQPWQHIQPYSYMTNQQIPMFQYHPGVIHQGMQYVPKPLQPTQPPMQLNQLPQQDDQFGTCLPFTAAGCDKLFQIVPNPAFGMQSHASNQVPAKNDDSGKKKFAPTCFNCYQDGHIAQDCPQERNLLLIKLNGKRFSEHLRSGKKTKFVPLKDLSAKMILCHFAEELSGEAPDAGSKILLER